MVAIHLPIYYLLIFFIAIIILSIKKKAISIHHPTDRKILLEIIAGYLIFIFAHALMILFAGA